MSAKKIIKALLPKFILDFRTQIVLRKLEKDFAGKSTKEVFSKIYSDKLWGDKNEDCKFNSGSGSRQENVVESYVDSIKKYFAEKGRLSVVDLGCGDFLVGSKVRHIFNDYTACDIVNELIEHHKTHFKDLNVNFIQLDMTKDEFPKADVLFVRQVLQHLSNELILGFMDKLKSSSYRLLVLTEHVPKGSFKANLDKPVGSGIRLGRGAEDSGVVLTEAPFFLKAKNQEVICEVPQMDGIIRTIVYTL